MVASYGSIERVSTLIASVTAFSRRLRPLHIVKPNKWVGLPGVVVEGLDADEVRRRLQKETKNLGAGKTVPPAGLDDRHLARVARSVFDRPLFENVAVAGLRNGVRLGAEVRGSRRIFAPGLRSIDAIAHEPGARELITAANVDAHAAKALFLLNIETGESRQLTHPPPEAIGDRSPRFSPDGSQVAFLRAFTAWRHDVMVVSATGGDPQALAHDTWGQIRGVEWTRKSILFSSNRAGQFALWRVSTVGGETDRIPIHDEWVTQPRVARDRSRLIYRTFRDSVDLWQLPLGVNGELNGEPTRRVASTRSERQGVLSPDGGRLAFLSDRTGSLEVWSGNVDGDRLLRHTELNGPRPGSPTWSPDGAQLAFDAAVHGHSDLWTVAASGL